MSDMKRCPACGKTKPMSEFSKTKARKDGYQGHCKACIKQYYEANKVAQLARVKGYYEANKDKYNSRKAKRKAWKLQATPVWSDLEAISEFYTCALAFKVYTGKEYHVDHIVPLNSKLVCGLHVPANLQLLEASENLSKGNRHWPDMP